MPRTTAILICDREELFRETLMNFLLAAGYQQIALATTVKEALRLLHQNQFDYVLIGNTRQLSLARRLKIIAQRLQPQARIVCMKRAWPQAFDGTLCQNIVLKERIYESLLEVLEASS